MMDGTISICVNPVSARTLSRKAMEWHIPSVATMKKTDLVPLALARFSRDWYECRG